VIALEDEASAASDAAETRAFFAGFACAGAAAGPLVCCASRASSSYMSAAGGVTAQGCFRVKIDEERVANDGE
jgi:hypothetical protein